MQTIKTAVVVVLLMVILYGAFVAMNGQETELPPDLEHMITMGPDFGFEGPSVQTGTTEPTKPTQTATPTAPENMPFAMWPETPKTTASTSVATIPPTASTQPSALLLPQDKSADVGKPSMPETKAEEKSTTAFAANSPAGKSGSESASSAPPSDPWLKTLENSVSGTPSIPPATEQTKLDPPSVPPVLKSDNPEFVVDSATEKTENKAESSEFSVTSQSFENAKTKALEQIEQGKLKESLQTLSLFYNSLQLTNEQRTDLLDMLDALAFEVIYSKRHLLDLPYIVAPGETLAQVAQMHDVPFEVLAKVNQISDTEKLAPGTKLKVMKGPFRSEINVSTKEMTVFLGDLYAGRFPVSTGVDPAPKEGVFQVIDKQKDKSYYGPNGLQISGVDPRNPYGGYWLDLGQQMSIHSSPTNPSNETDRLGCISLSPIDATDVFTMLSRGSQVTIKR